jgi:hypothetical protein
MLNVLKVEREKHWLFQLIHYLYCIWVPSWSYDSLNYNYLCNQCLSPLKFRGWIPLRRCVLDTTLCDKVCQWLAPGRWFSPVSSTNKTDRYDITEILLKVALNTLTLTITLDCIWCEIHKQLVAMKLSSVCSKSKEHLFQRLYTNFLINTSDVWCLQVPLSQQK